MMEWDNQQQPNNHHSSNLQGIDVNGGSGAAAVGGGGGGMYVKVMTDEQLETLRKQIAIYATICERLVEMHKTLTAQQDLAGLFSSSLVSFSVHTKNKKGLLCNLKVSEFLCGLVD